MNATGVQRSTRRSASSSVVVRVSVNKVTLLQSPQQSTLQAKLRNCTRLTVYIQGPFANGRLLGDLVRQCDNLQSLLIERRDNDWDAPDTSVSLADSANLLGRQLSQYTTQLQEFSLVGLTGPPIEELCDSLCTIPTLASVTLKGEGYFAKHNSAPPLMSALNLQNLLNHLTQHLSVSALFPEVSAYQQVLSRAYIRDGCRLHIYVHFSGSNGVVSPFSYFLRQVMVINQQSSTLSTSESASDDSRRIEQVLKLLAKRRNFSLDVAYLLVRENPWLCNKSVSATATKADRGSKWKRIQEWAAKKRGSSFFRPSG